MPAAFPKHGAIFAKELANDMLALGFSEQQVFRGSGLSPDLLEPVKPVIEFDRIASFYEHASQLTGDDLLGFVRGQKREVSHAGLISYVGTSSPTVQDFIKNVAHYLRVFSDAYELNCDELESNGILDWHFSVSESVIRRQYVEFSASGLLQAIRQATKRVICPDLVTFRHARNAHTDEFESFFGCDVRFGTPGNTFQFNLSDLKLPLVSADDELFRVLRNCCEHALQIKARNIPPLVVQVERMISERLTKGEATQDDISRALGMSPRTLSRRLADEGTSFFKILEGLRKSLAINYLRDSSLVLAEIAFLLGYSGLSSFSDAFKRWTGRTPGQFRSD